MKRLLAEGFQVNADAVDDSAWHDIAGASPDANIYQLWQHRSAGAPRRTSKLLLAK